MANLIAPSIDEYQGTHIVDESNNVAWEVADFLFGAKSIKNIAEGKGTWGDAAILGITAATFLIPPAKIALLGNKALRKVLAETITVNASTSSLPVVAKAASKTRLEIEAELARRGKPVEYNPTVTTAEDVRTLEANITLGPRATADDLIEYQALQGPAKFMERNPDVKDASFLTNKNDIPSVDTSGRAVANSERAADAKVKRDLNTGSPDEIRTAQKVDELNTKTPREPVKRSAIGAQLDEVLLDKDTLQEMLTLSGKEVGRDQVGKVVGTLRRLAQKEKDPEIRREIYKDIEDLKKNGVSTNIVDRIKSEVAKLDKKATTLQGYIDDPTSSAAIRQTKANIPVSKVDKKTGAVKQDWAASRSYETTRPSGKSGKAPDSPARSTLTELKSDEKSLMKMLEKESDPTRRKQLRSDLKVTRKQIFDAEVGRGRQYIEDTTSLRKELDNLREQWSSAKNNKTKNEIKKRGQEVAARLKKLEGN
jgi:hypothetical protein